RFPLRILTVATKCPWPPRDGGRLVLWWTLLGLVQAGHDVALVAPANPEPSGEPIPGVRTYLVRTKQHSWPSAALRAVAHRTALSNARHRLNAMNAGVTDAIAEFQPDVVHVEQLQALANCSRAQSSDIPIVLRMQNVESSIWQQMSTRRAP